MPRRPRCRRHGAVLIDALIGIFILGMGAVSYYAVLPVIHRGHETAQQESKAAQIAARVTEHFSMLRPSDVTYETLSQMNLVDPGQGNTPPWTFTHLPMDDGTDYSPAKVLRKGTGTISTSGMSNGSILVMVKIDWKTPTGFSRSYTTGTVVGGYR